MTVFAEWNLEDVRLMDFFQLLFPFSISVERFIIECLSPILLPLWVYFRSNVCKGCPACRDMAWARIPRKDVVGVRFPWISCRYSTRLSFTAMPGTTSGNRLNTKSLRIFQACTFVVVYEVVRVSSFCFAFNGNDITAFDSAICLGCLRGKRTTECFSCQKVYW